MDRSLTQIRRINTLEECVTRIERRLVDERLTAIDEKLFTIDGKLDLLICRSFPEPRKVKNHH